MKKHLRASTHKIQWHQGKGMLWTPISGCRWTFLTSYFWTCLGSFSGSVFISVRFVLSASALVELCCALSWFLKLIDSSNFVLSTLCYTARFIEVCRSYFSVASYGLLQSADRRRICTLMRVNYSHWQSLLFRGFLWKGPHWQII